MYVVVIKATEVVLLLKLGGNEVFVLQQNTSAAKQTKPTASPATLTSV
jgi:hypothetical protein